MTRAPEGPPSYDFPRWSLGETPWLAGRADRAGTRVIVDNDFSGDPDDLAQLAHQLLSPGAEVRAVVASHLFPGDPVDPGPETATNAELVAADLLARMGLATEGLLHRGAQHALLRAVTPDAVTPVDSPAVRAILAEALSDDPRPLLYLAGGGLTDLASAVLLDPRVAERLTLVWIGGAEHPGLAATPPGSMPIEYNLRIDVVAAQVLFATPALRIWQVPRNTYRQCLVSAAELELRLGRCGAVGRYVLSEIAHVRAGETAGAGGDVVGREVGESYALGDSPLVLLSALRSTYGTDSHSSEHVEVPTPLITDDGEYRSVPGARPMRVYTRLDVRLMLEDMFAKLELFARWQEIFTPDAGRIEP